VNDPWEGSSDYADVKVAKALSHALRIQILAVLNKQVMSPSQYAERFHVPLPTVSYHFRVLLKADCLRIVHEVARGNRTERYYCATRRALFDSEAWENLPETIRNKLSARTISDLIETIAKAMEAETFDSRVDRVLVWQKSYLDEQGWEEAAEVHHRRAKEMTEIEERSRARLLRSGEKGLIVTSGMLLFESPYEEPEV